MGTPSRVCLSLIQSDSSLLAVNQVRESNTSLGDPSMVSPTVVCNIVRNVNTEPSPSTNKSPSSSVTQRRDSSPPNEALVTTSRVGCLRKSLHTMALSKQTEELMLKSWSKGTYSAYNTAWSKWASWCLEREVDPLSAPITSFMEFLSWMFYEGFQYRTINVHRSVISSVLPDINSLSVGQHYLIKNIMRGILKGNPPLPRYKEMWDVYLQKYMCRNRILVLPMRRDLHSYYFGKFTECF